MYGAFQGYARAFYAELIPPGEEARWYALFSITDKVRLCPLPSRPLPSLTNLSRVVQLVLRPPHRRSHSRHNRQHPLCLFLLGGYDLVCGTGVDECGC